METDYNYLPAVVEDLLAVRNKEMVLELVVMELDHQLLVVGPYMAEDIVLVVDIGPEVDIVVVGMAAVGKDIVVDYNN